MAEKKKATKATKATKKPTLDMKVDKGTAAEEAIKSKRLLKQVIEGLSGENRRMRQYCASVVCRISDYKVETIQPFSAELADALHRPEAQTRWEILKALTRLVEIDARAIDKAISGAEASLFDEDSGVARLEAFRLLCAYGATTETRSEKVWPYIDEAVQCYHGDPEYDAMLDATLMLIAGESSKKVRKEAAARMKFDAENAKGTLGVRSAKIVKEAKKRR